MFVWDFGMIGAIGTVLELCECVYLYVRMKNYLENVSASVIIKVACEILYLNR